MKNRLKHLKQKINTATTYYIKIEMAELTLTTFLIT